MELKSKLSTLNKDARKKNEHLFSEEEEEENHEQVAKGDRKRLGARVIRDLLMIREADTQNKIQEAMSKQWKLDAENGKLSYSKMKFETNMRHATTKVSVEKKGK